MKKLTKLTLTLLIILFQLSIVSAQVGINNDNSDPDVSAMLDVKSTDKGMLVPRLDSTARNSILNPAVGLLVYDSTTTTFWYYDEMQWNEIRSSSKTITAEDLVSTSDTSNCLAVRSRLILGSFPRYVAVANNFAYVVDPAASDLKVIDVSNPNAASLLGSIGINNSPRSISVVNNFAYTVDAVSKLLSIIDVSDPNNPTLSSTLEIGIELSGSVTFGDYTYVIDAEDDSLFIVDVSDAMNPIQIGAIKVGSEPDDIATDGNYVYITDHVDGTLLAIDVRTPTMPVLSDSLAIGNVRFPKIAIENNYAYIVEQENDDLTIYDISDPTNITSLGSIGSGSGSAAVAVENGLAYVVNVATDDLRVIDVTDPNNPTLVSQLVESRLPRDVAVSNGVVYIVDGSADDLKVIAACDAVLTIDGATGELTTTTIEEIAAIESIKDVDEDTKILVEESTDEDIIRFDIAGEEKWRMENNALIPANEGEGIFIGEDAGASDSLFIDFLGGLRSTDNIFIGNSAGFDNTTGINNTVLGNLSLLNNTTGESNIAIGTSNLQSNTTGSTNIAIGATALQSNNGDDNIVIGAGAARISQTGDGNVVVGKNAINQQTGGNNNVALGKEAGAGNAFHDKSNSTYIGYRAGFFNQGDDNVFIGSQVANSVDWVDVDSTLAIDIEGTTSPLIYGEFNNDLVRINGDLEVTGNFPTSNIIADTDNDTKIQIEESADEDIIRFDIAGGEKWRMENNTLIPTNEGNGIFIGENAGASDSLFTEFFGNARNTDNIFVGNFAGFNNTTGFNNTVVGNFSLANNTTGRANVAIGASNLQGNITGTDNVAIGIAALQSNNGSDNVAIGAGAAKISESGNGNVTIGEGAASQQMGGSNNVVVGMEAAGGNVFHDKSNSTYLGYRAGRFNQGNDNVFLGSQVASSVDWVDVDSTLAIDIEGTTSPLVYGEFNNDLIRINGDLEVTGSFPNTDDQSLRLSNDTLYIEDGNAVDLDLADNQILFLINDNLSISSGNTVDLSVIDTDDQTLDFDGTNLSIADGNSVDISSVNSIQSIVEDADEDTKIQVDEGDLDEDIIRFDTEGEERWRISNYNLIPTNPGDGIFIGENAGINDQFLMGFAKTLNIFIGTGSGRTTTTGFTNIGVGASSLELNETGASNVALGASALRFSTMGNRNTALGHRAAISNTIGSNNVAVGFEALSQQQEGSLNVGVGTNSGGGNVPHTKVGSTYLGANAGQFNQGNRNIFIGADVASSANWINVDSTLAIDVEDNNTPLIYGEFDNDLIRINGDLEVTGSFPDTDDQMLSFDGTNLSITDGNSVNISGVDTDTDDQKIDELNLNGTTLEISLTDDGEATKTLDLSSLVPVGTIQMWVTDTPPTDWLICDGQNITAYPKLVAVLGSNNAPDLRRHFPLGAQNIVPQGQTPRPLKSTGGEEEVTLNINQIPAHSHSVTVDYNQRSFSGSNNGASDLQGSGDGETFTSSTKGGDQPHNNMPPYYALHFIIKAK